MKALTVKGSTLVDRSGSVVILRGVSLFWSQWVYRFYNIRAIQWLVEDWNISVIRVPLGIEYDGYLENPKVEIEKVERIIEAAIACNIYVIVDWHSHYKHLGLSRKFFRYISRKYGDIPNIIYEPWNEPDSVFDWDNDIRPYFQSIIEDIRVNAPGALVLVGTENFCQRIDKVVTSPLQFDNILYTFHFYAASHRRRMRKRLINATSNGVAIFVSEFGTCEASGGGMFDPKETRRWLKCLEKRGVSYVNWAISDKLETASALNVGASSSGFWKPIHLTPSGRLIRSMLRSFKHAAKV